MISKQIQKKLNELVVEANKYDLMVRNTLQNAYRCGQALLQMKKIIVKHFSHGHWQKWLKKNLPKIPYSSAAEYMRIARNWNSPELKNARNAGEVFTSIKSVLDFSVNKQAKDTSPPKPPTEKQQEAAEVRERLRETFDHYLPSLTHDELLMFNTIFNPLETGLWEKIADELHSRVCCKFEYDPYEYEFSFENSCPLLNEKNADQYLKYVQNHPQDGNNLFDRRRKFQMSELISDIAKTRMLVAWNKKRAPKNRLKQMRSRLTEREKQLQSLKQFMEN